MTEKAIRRKLITIPAPLVPHAREAVRRGFESMRAVLEVFAAESGTAACLELEQGPALLAALREYIAAQATVKQGQRPAGELADLRTFTAALAGAVGPGCAIDSGSA